MVVHGMASMPTSRSANSIEGNGRDVTEQTKSQEQLDQEAAELDSVNEKKSEEAEAQQAQTSTILRNAYRGKS